MGEIVKTRVQLNLIYWLKTNRYRPLSLNEMGNINLDTAVQNPLLKKDLYEIVLK